MAVKLSASRAHRPLPPGIFLELISVRACVDPRAILRMKRLGKLKKFNDLIRNRTRDLLDCYRVPQPTTLYISRVYKFNVTAFINASLFVRFKRFDILSIRRNEIPENDISIRPVTYSFKHTNMFSLSDPITTGNCVVY
jgi:hypothetical protein